MRVSRTALSNRDGRWRLGAGLTCCAALLLGLAAVLTVGSSTWLVGGLGLAALVLLGAGGGLVVAHVLLGKATSEMATDPVCGMTVEHDEAPHYRQEGKTWFFCSPACRDEFTADPVRFTHHRHDFDDSHHGHE